ncbi:STAS domain-containing protein [Bacillus sp. FJAT-49711]|uniref:STAS domain-containing protein n=1 Tax=Bacillus sp. FJAT-49711 TaxID=2833585 RepID=UPI001BC95B88|nr:STAS domain-containing protein [Bacillus sp. FJAT-49711]MBS4217633.1 STAS domain-containing protein [Bacillus sp. FJAT-49711]
MTDQHIENKISEFLIGNVPNITSDWIEQAYTSGIGVYAQSKDSEAYNQIRSMNKEFILALTNSIFGKDAALNEWASSIASTRALTATPLYDVIVNFSLFRSVYYSYIEIFIEEHANIVSGKMVINWIRTVSSKFDEAIQLVTKKYMNDYEYIFSSQQETILELGTPVIKIDKTIGIIPLVGEIDTYRASKILETSLKKASEMELEWIILDLSGVPVIDTMVANQIFQLGETFRLLDISMILTGMRPEIAQTSISLGLDFSRLKTFAHLYQAIHYLRDNLSITNS